MYRTINQTDDGNIPSSYALPSDSSFFVTQSFVFDPREVSQDAYTVYYILFALAVFILLQSAYINGRKMHFVRFCADGCAWCTIAFGLLLLGSIIRPNPTKSAICYDFLAQGIFQVIFQLFDNYIFIQQIEVVQKLHRWKKISIHVYIWSILVAPWASAYLIVPFFFDTNSERFLEGYDVTLQIQLWGAIAYNFYFTIEFARILNKIYSKSTIRNDSVIRAKIIALKSLTHCFLSITANLLYVYEPRLGNGTYNIIILTSMHFLFNYKIEKTDRYISNLHKEFNKIIFKSRSMNDVGRIYLVSNSNFEKSEALSIVDLKITNKNSSKSQIDSLLYI